MQLNNCVGNILIISIWPILIAQGYNVSTFISIYIQFQRCKDVSIVENLIGYKFIHESVFPRIVQFPRRPPSIDPQKYERTTFPLFQLHIYISRENLRGWSTVKHAIVQREVDSTAALQDIYVIEEKYVGSGGKWRLMGSKLNEEQRKKVAVASAEPE